MKTITGVGLGLRHGHFNEFINNKPDVPWLEVHTENFLNEHSFAAKRLDKIRQDYAISAHCVSLSLGTAGQWTEKKHAHLQSIKQTLARLEPVFVSDHISWSSPDNIHYAPELYPLPYTEEALDVICDNVLQAQDILQRQLILENPSSYLHFQHSVMSEAEFIAALVKRTGCGLLLDVNNLFVSAHNLDFSAHDYLETIDFDAVKEIHLAGFSVDHIAGQQVYIDTHGAKVYDGVWQLFQYVVNNFKPVPTLIEWDNDLPEFDVLYGEKLKADAIIADMIKG
ncbi:MNIO family bufferin maturase [Thalassotalea sp. PLHSN55]|uniref:MNIO family bufferin maturase n=1 Tax=Thalassotalea sp. PLHSN55 TaxID=3435888 RepID=UPI003F86FE0F